MVALSVAASLGVDTAVSAGSIRLAALDAVTVVVLGAGAIGVAIGRLRFDRPTWPWLILLALLAVGAARGVTTFGLEPAANATRLLGAFLVPATFVAMQRHHLARIAEWMAWSVCLGAAVLGVAAVVFLARNGLSSYTTSGERALDSLGALLVAQAAMIAASRRSWPVGLRTAATVAAVTVLTAAQVRTVVIAAIAGALVLAVASSKRGRVRTLASLALGGVAVVVVAGSMSGFSQSLRYASSEPFQSGSTFEWRTRGWVELLGSQLDDSGLNLAVGDPAGSGTARRIRIDGQVREVQYSAHSQWVTTILATGVVGLATWSGVVAWIVWRSVRFRRPELAGWYAAGATAIVFSITYQLGADQGLVIGFLAATAALGAAWAGDDTTDRSDVEPTLVDAS
jgi:hypothetical protein